MGKVKIKKSDVWIDMTLLLPLRGEFTVGEMITFMTYLDMLVWPLQAIGWLLNIGQRASISYRRIEKLMEETSEVEETPQALPITEAREMDVAIHNFQYEDVPTLEDVAFSLHQGQTLGIVGPTGSGKSTLLKLFLRQYDAGKEEHYGHESGKRRRWKQFYFYQWSTSSSSDKWLSGDDFATAL